MTLQDALVAYRTYAGAEGKSPKTVAWVASSVGYFAEFLGPEQQGIGAITGNDLRRFIIALQGKPKFANHPYNKPQQAKLSSQSIETYCRAIKAFFSFLKREGFIENDAMAKVKMPNGTGDSNSYFLRERSRETFGSASFCCSAPRPGASPLSLHLRRCTSCQSRCASLSP